MKNARNLLMPDVCLGDVMCDAHSLRFGPTASALECWSGLIYGFFLEELGRVVGQNAEKVIYFIFAWILVKHSFLCTETRIFSA